MRRDEFVPLAWFAAIVVFLFVIASAASAHADPGTDVCRTLDNHPTVGGVIDALDDLRAAGLTSREAGGALADAITNDCPGHAGLLQQVLARGRERVA